MSDEHRYLAYNVNTDRMSFHIEQMQFARSIECKVTESGERHCVLRALNTVIRQKKSIDKAYTTNAH